MNKEFYMLHDNDLVTSVRKLITEGSTLKSYIFRAIISDTNVDKYSGTYFMSHVNSFLSFWEEFANNMAEKMRKVNARPTRSISYSDVKDYIYADHDYNSIVGFASGVVEGVKDGKFKTRDDFGDFFAHTVSKAFGIGGNQPDSIGGLMDSSVEASGLFQYVNNSETEVRMFNTIKNNRNLFKNDDRTTLTKSIKKVIDFITDSVMVTDKLRKSTSIDAFISSINYIIDYMIYALAVYASRIYVINLFAYPFIISAPTPVSEFAESTNLPSTGDNINSTITIMRDADEVQCKDINNTRELYDVFSRFTTMIGADEFFNGEKPKYSKHTGRMKPNNLFNDKLYTNELYRFLCGEDTPYISGETNLKELNTMLKYIVFNPTQGLQHSSSPKNGFLVLMRSIEGDKTIKGYRRLAANLFEFVALAVSTMICCIENNIDAAKSVMDPTSHIVPTIQESIKVTANENVRILADLYSELVYLFLQKGRDIETKYNELNGKTIHDIVGLKIPSFDHGLKQTTSDITGAVPDTTRVPLEITDIYAMPSFECFQYYDEAVKMLCGLQNDLYFSEAFNVSEMTNKIKAILTAALNRMKNWFENKNRQAAFSYVKQHGDELLRMDFTGQSMQVMPFKDDKNTHEEQIDVSPVIDMMDKLVNTITTGNLDQITNKQFNPRAMYAPAQIYDWYTKDPKTGAVKYRNWILYEDDVNKVTDKIPNMITINGDDIKKRVNNWVTTCRNAEKYYRSIEQQIKKYQGTQDQMKNKLATLVSGTANTTNPSKTEDPGPTNYNSNQIGTPPQLTDKQNQNNVQQNKQQDQQAKNTERAAAAETLLNEMQNVLNRVFLPMLDAITFYIDSNYRYLRIAYSKGKGQGQQNQAAASNNQNVPAPQAQTNPA